jgi:hypothetical protein
MASRLVLALVCRIASRSVLSGIFTVVFTRIFSLRSESPSMGHNGNEYSDFIENGISHSFKRYGPIPSSHALQSGLDSRQDCSGQAPRQRLWSALPARPVCGRPVCSCQSGSDLRRLAERIFRSKVNFRIRRLDGPRLFKNEALHTRLLATLRPARQFSLRSA